MAAGRKTAKCWGHVTSPWESESIHPETGPRPAGGNWAPEKQINSAGHGATTCRAQLGPDKKILHGRRHDRDTPGAPGPGKRINAPGNNTATCREQLKTAHRRKRDRDLPGATGTGTKKRNAAGGASSWAAATVSRPRPGPRKHRTVWPRCPRRPARPMRALSPDTLRDDAERLGAMPARRSADRGELPPPLPAAVAEQSPDRQVA